MMKCLMSSARESVRKSQMDGDEWRLGIGRQNSFLLFSQDYCTISITYNVYSPNSQLCLIWQFVCVLLIPFWLSHALSLHILILWPHYLRNLGNVHIIPTTCCKRPLTRHWFYLCAFPFECSLRSRDKTVLVMYIPVQTLYLSVRLLPLEGFFFHLNMSLLIQLIF